MSLYDIQQDIMDCIDTETGEIIDAERLDALQMEKKEKVKNIALWIINLRGEAESSKERETYFAQRKKRAEKKIEGLTEYLSKCLNGEKVKDDDFEIGWKQSQATEITDETKLPEQYLTPVPPKVNRMAILKDLKKGLTVDGAMLVTRNNIQVR